MSQPIHDAVIADINGLYGGHLSAETTAKIVDVVNRQSDKGLKKYGVPVTPDCSAYMINHALEEAVDLSVYLTAIFRGMDYEGDAYPVKVQYSNLLRTITKLSDLLVDAEKREASK